MRFCADFYKGKKILITGHSGFKGSWMCKILEMAGADVTGYALAPPTNPSLFELTNLKNKITSITGDIRDLDHLNQVFNQIKPKIVIHMAAQPIVRESYRNPVYTYETNVMGTVNILECVRNSSSVKSFINVTTDKVYLNKEWQWGYRENEELNGFDPYSNSKSCSELVTSSYINSFFKDRDVAITTCRAGNVIGGGDFAVDRIIPDCIRAVENNKDIIIRNPFSTRPYQHVLEPVMAYLMIAQAQYEDKGLAGNYNVGPDEMDCWTTGNLVSLFCNEWQTQTGMKLSWINERDQNFHEASFLKLDNTKIKATFNWKSTWNIQKSIKKVVEWYKCYLEHGDVETCMQKQIKDFLEIQ